ncbi:hypothetical protein HUU53_03875 [Candidatus Micrarchaeota archaeon]|nr:hypothetical protein [Candidatus Micrarchaeota archaeon]
MTITENVNHDRSLKKLETGGVANALKKKNLTHLSPELVKLVSNAKKRGADLELLYSSWVKLFNHSGVNSSNALDLAQIIHTHVSKEHDPRVLIDFLYEHDSLPRTMTRDLTAVASQVRKARKPSEVINIAKSLSKTGRVKSGVLRSKLRLNH